MACYYPFGHCIVCPSQIDGLLLHLSSLYCLSISDLWLVITSLVIVLSVLRFIACYYPFGHCIVCPSQIYGLLLPLWPLYCLSSDLWLVITPLAIVLSVLLRFMACYYLFGHCIVCPQIYGLLLHLWSFYCLSFSELWLVITSLVIVLSVLLRFMACYYPFGHCILCPQIDGLLLLLWLLYCLSFSDLWLVITPLAIALSVLRFMICYYPFGHCIVCPSQIDGLLLPLWLLYFLSFSDLWLVITHLAIVLSVLLRVMACYYPFGHCIIFCPQIYGLLLPL